MKILIWGLLLLPMLILYRVSTTTESRKTQRNANAFFSGFLFIDALIVGAEGMAGLSSTEMNGVAVVAVVQLAIAGYLLEEGTSLSKKSKRDQGGSS